VHASKTQYAELLEHAFRGELVRAASAHLVPPSEKVSYTVIDVLIDRSVRLQASPIAEVRRPPAQKRVEPIAHFNPCPGIAGHQDFSDLRLEGTSKNSDLREFVRV
jgi:hypothetical protein